MTDSEGETTNEIMPHPFYHYRDHSRDVNPDPLTPLTIAGRMPNFPAKLHAILSQPDFADIIAWLPHGRSWLVLNPREFESTILPVYFKTSKFSSFVRQANGKFLAGPMRPFCSIVFDCHVLCRTYRRMGIPPGYARS